MERGAAPHPSPARRVGAWGAGCAAFLSLAYIVAQLFEWSGLLGSAGGPNSASTPLGLAVLLLPSLLLGPAFVVALAALCLTAPRERRVFALAGLSLGIVYAALTGLVYSIQLLFVGPRLAAGETADIALLLFVPYRSFLFAVDLWGYSLMSAATLFAAFAVTDRWTRIALVANGALMPFLALQMLVPALIWPASVWAVTFPAAMLLLVRVFRRAGAGEGALQSD